MSTVTFDDGRVRLEIKPSDVFNSREIMMMFDALAEYLRDIGVEVDSFSASIVVDYLDNRN
jgi:hypothetical protein